MKAEPPKPPITEATAMRMALKAISLAKNPLDERQGKIIAAKTYMRAMLKERPRYRRALINEAAKALGIDLELAEAAVEETPLVRYHSPQSDDTVLCLPEMWMERFND